MIENKEFKGLLEVLHQAYGYDFRNYAETSVMRRIKYFMDNRKIDSLSELQRALLEKESIFEEFVQELSITVTEMFRDPSFYGKLREILTQRLATYPFIKIWVAGCATGQEVYSISILLSEEGLLRRSLIYATDINQRSLEVAKKGMYPVENMQLYTSNYQKAGGKGSFSQYYKSKFNAVLFDQTLTDNVVFSPHNLVSDRSFNEFQLIICRNVIMYFNQQLQDRVIDLFYESLCPFGVLGLGDKESLLFSSNKNLFEEIDRKDKIYMKIK